MRYCRYSWHPVSYTHLDLDLPWAEGDDEPDAPVAAAPVKAKRRPQPGLAPLPSIDLLDRPPAKTQMMSKDELERMGRLVEAKLADYNVQALSLIHISPSARWWNQSIPAGKLWEGPCLAGCSATSLAVGTGGRLPPVSYTHLDVYKRQG